jgi:DNA-binding CsgD family transcriptional regulator
MQSKEIAAVIPCSRATVEQKVQFLFAKLGALSRPHLVALAILEGRIRVEDIAEKVIL